MLPARPTQAWIPRLCPSVCSLPTLEAPDNQLVPFSPNSRPPGPHLVICTPGLVWDFKRSPIYVQPFSSFTHVLPALPTTANICSLLLITLTDLTVVRARFRWNSGPLPSVSAVQGLPQPPRPLSGRLGGKLIHHVSRESQGLGACTAKPLECRVLLWVGQLFDRRQGVFSEHLQRPRRHMVALTQQFIQNGPQGQMCLELLPPALGEPVGLQGHKARG